MNKAPFRDLHPTTSRLLLARALRSIGQGALVVDFALYLHALQWSGLGIGLVLGGSGLAGAALSLLVGFTSDRFRREPFLLAYEGVSLLSGLAALLTVAPWVLVIATAAGQFGRGAMGAAGPFSPAEQAWLAEEVVPRRRGWVYRLNAGFGFWGMALGAVFGMLPEFWDRWLPGPIAYRPLFGLVVLTAAANLALLAKQGSGITKQELQGIDGRGAMRRKQSGAKRTASLRSSCSSTRSTVLPFVSVDTMGGRHCLFARSC
jgi:MFS family permease